MKHFYLYLLVFTFTNFLHAQLDTSFQQTKIVETVFESQNMVDAKHYLLNSLLDEKQVLRLGFEGTSLSYTNEGLYNNLPLANSLFLEYEHRIKIGFSINTQLHYNRATIYAISQIFIPYVHSPITHNYGFHIEPRWYFKKRKQLASTKSGNNLSGIYTSLLAGVRYVQSENPRYRSYDGRKQFLKSQYQYGTLNLGWQRRFGKYGFLHFQLGTGIKHVPQKVITVSTPTKIYEFQPFSKWQWITAYKASVGLAIGSKNDTKIDHSFWSYRQDDYDMWKVDLFGLFYELNKAGISGKINIGYEKSIKQSAFSIATNVLYFQQVFPDAYWDKQNQLSIQIAPRFYYNLKKRMQKGKTANDLSAEYFSIRNQWNISKSRGWQENYSVSLLWGIQRRVFEHMYINYELGHAIPPIKTYLPFSEIISELKIGFAF